MDYFDELLNVYAYLSKKQNLTNETSKRILRKLEDLSILTDTMHTDLENDLRRTKELAYRYGIPIDEEQILASAVNHRTLLSDEKIIIKEDFNVKNQFRVLVSQAREAGFTNTHPEELLTEQEMCHAEDFEKQLDMKFAHETGLTENDMNVMTIAIALQITCFMLFRYFKGKVSLPNSSKENDSNIFKTLNVKQAKVIKNCNQILTDSIPFLVNEKTDADVLGKDKYLGWIFGTMNIMTDTITLRSMKSYQVVRTPSSAGTTIDKLISTTAEVLWPVVNNGLSKLPSLTAALIREAFYLFPNKFAYSTVEEAWKNLASESNVINKIVSKFQNKNEVKNSIQETEFSNLINFIITLIHTLHYRIEIDGEKKLYFVRTQKIIAYSQVIAVTCNSLPAIVSGQWSNLDFTGLINAILCSFHSIRFWINAKSDFIISNHLELIKKELEYVDSYFK